ncbi:amino acid permease [Aspergillus luchuensis]|uniref:Amino acid permease n=1 Tax=Aspergillus kawachii TaxID=1069201 RepID=A0A146F5M8_ASPKA|nr:amino acid permease [Aspergillus luchuensis]
MGSLFLIWKLYKKTKLVPLSEIDLETDRYQREDNVDDRGLHVSEGCPNNGIGRLRAIFRSNSKAPLPTMIKSYMPGYPNV